MKNKIEVKENIIKVTTELIEKNDGNIKNITARTIAQKAGIGLGLINYHFGSKENLITSCVQRIINDEIIKFDTKKEYATDKERLTAWAVYVFNFLYEHSAVCRISILSDLQNYTADCNSAYSQRGFILALTKDIEDKDKPILSFILTASMQVAFLSGNATKELLGYDFTQPVDRAAYIESLVATLFDGRRKEGTL